MGQDEDPNASRRKRRKTAKASNTEQDTTLQSGLSGWLGKENPSIASSTNFAADDEPQPGTGTLDTPPSPPTSKDTGQLGASSTDGKAPNPQDGSKRRTLKLNANGRLLSSPPATPQPGTSMSTKETGGRQSRPRKAKSKLVALKYDINRERNVGDLIDKILSGQMVQSDAPKRRTVPAPKAQPAKPTHPFFLKKQAQKGQLEGQSVDQSSGQTPESNTPASSRSLASTPKPEPRTFPSAPTTGRRVSKFPGLIDALWPPRDLVHIRGGEQLETPALNSNPDDHKKAKSAVVTISNEENALLTSTACARKTARQSLEEGGDDRTLLRLPGRHVASGRVLQTAIDSQMSWSLPNSRSTANSSIPVIGNLREGLLSTFSAFDRGKYESQLWSHKYAPQRAQDVLQIGREAHVLRDWLRHLKITAVDTGKSSKEDPRSKSKREKKQHKRRKKADKLDGFIVSSDEEASEMDNLSGSDDELAGDVTVQSQRTVIRSGDICRGSPHGADKQVTNAILLSGFPGSGKTASVYAVAKELDFEVFEINSGSRRTARDMLERVGDMTQNHLVHLLNESGESSRRPQSLGGSDDDGKQNKLMGFFKGPPFKSAKWKEKASQKIPTPEPETKRKREQKQSLILIEEADILFEEDKQFWTGVLTLISQSRRPIVMTCNDESLVPTTEMSLHAILRFQKPPRDLAIDYLLLVAANEGHVLKRDSVSSLYDGSGMDLRKSLMELNFWCQMGVGSEKAGLDWILSIWPPEANVDQNGDRVRVLSLNTYEPYMGWFNRDLLLGEDRLSQQTEILQNIFHWWRLGIQDAEDAAGCSDAELVPSDQFQSRSRAEQLSFLSREADYLDMRSSLDVLSSGCPMDKFKVRKDTPKITKEPQLTLAQDVLDASAPPPPESHRSNYIEAYPLLHADARPEYSSLSETISVTFNALLSQEFRARSEDTESAGVDRIFNSWSQSAERRHKFPSSLPGFRKVFEPIMRANYTMPLPSGRHAPSFENGLAPITEDLAPYVRAIMAFDGRLKEYRDKLIAICSNEGDKGKKRGRTTRASRAALEGGDKASMRKERWFPDDTNYFWVQNTGNPEWQDALYQMGHFHVQPTIEPTQDTGDTTSSEDPMII